MTEAGGWPTIWLDGERLGIPDLTASGWERLESPDYAAVFRKEGASSFAVRVRGADEADDVPERWRRVHAVPAEAVRTSARRFAGRDAVEHEAPCGEAELLRTVVVRTERALIDIGQLAPADIDHRARFEAFLAEVRLEGDAGRGSARARVNG